MRVCVIGGGVAGLSAAYDLASAGVSVTVMEAGSRWGGKVFSSPVGERVVDAGPDNFLARVPDAVDLCTELGLADRFTVPVGPKPAYIFRGGELYPLPSGTMLGVPTDFAALTGLISPAGIARAQQDLTLEPTALDTSTSVADYCRARLGNEVTDTLIDPMVGGINASSIEYLSLADGAPQLFDAARAEPSMVKGLRSIRASVGATLGSAAQNQPVFHGLEGGMAVLIDRLVQRLIEMGATLQTAREVTATAEVSDHFDHVIVATPAHVTAHLVADSSPTVAELVARIEHASVAQLTIESPEPQMEALDASGVLVPRQEGLTMTACTWFSTKWSQYARPDHHLVRITSGRFHDRRAIEMSDSELTRNLLGDFSTVCADLVPTGSELSPSAARIVRWVDAFPQYQPGHASLVDDAMAALAQDAPTIHLIGNSYRGIGIPATIRLARQTAASITQ